MRVEEGVSDLHSGGQTDRSNAAKRPSLRGVYFNRTLRSLLAGIGAILVIFFITRTLANPAERIAPLEASPAQLEAARDQLGYNRPLWSQFGEFLKSVSTLDFPDSLWERRPAMEVIGEALPRTILLIVSGLFLGCVLGICAGLYAGLRAESRFGRGLMATSIVFVSMPEFWVGLMLIQLFAVKLNVLPTSGLGGLRYLILPAVTLAIQPAGRIARVFATTVADTVRQPHVVGARARGLPQSFILRSHVVRNALNPVVTMSGWEFVKAISGSAALVETVFAWPGIGYMIVQASRKQDVPLIETTVVVVVIMVVVVNLLVDLAHKKVEPRAQL